MKKSTGKLTPREYAYLMITECGSGTAALEKTREAIAGFGAVMMVNPPQAAQARALRDYMTEVEQELMDLCAGLDTDRIEGQQGRRLLSRDTQDGHCTEAGEAPSAFTSSERLGAWAAHEPPTPGRRRRS